MLIACSSHLIGFYSTYFSWKRQKVTSCPRTPQGNFEDRERVKIYPDVDLTVDIMDPKTKTIVRVTGRADWAFGYSGRQEIAHGTYLVAIEAKRYELFSCGQSQLLTHLAILRELCIRAGKTNIIAQSFYTDGYWYCFMAVDVDGKIERSPIYDISSQQDRKTVFNFIITILEAALKSSPTVTPAKADEQHDKEINNFEGEIWSMFYSPYPADMVKEFDATPEVDLDDWFRRCKK